MNASDWIIQILLGGLMGTMGQGVRTIVGLKKLGDKSVGEEKTFSENFQTHALVTSLFIGFVAGVFATFAISQPDGKLALSKDELLGLAAAGYGGTDFIEGFAKKYLPTST